MLLFGVVRRCDKQLPRHAKVQEQPVAIFKQDRKQLTAPAHLRDGMPLQQGGKLRFGWICDYLRVANIHGQNTFSRDLRLYDSSYGFDLR